MPETEHFINEGFGWTCKRCRDDAHARASLGDALSTSHGDALPRFFREGEAEEREPRLSTVALARWRETGDGRRILFCPSCGAAEDESG